MLARTQHTLLLTKTVKHAAPIFTSKQAAPGAKTVSEHEYFLLRQQNKTMIGFQQNFKDVYLINKKTKTTQTKM